MNDLYKAYCRIYQGAFRIGIPMLPWRKPEVLEGEGSVERLPSFIKEKGIKKVLIVTDAGIMKLGLADGLMKGLEKEGLLYKVYDKTVPNPTIDNIEEALKDYKEFGAEALVAIGGGSAMDCAKGVGARVARPNKTIRQMKGVMKVLKKLPPLFAIPTTAGTGSEATIAAVVTDSATHEKYPLNDICLMPHYAILDPLLTEKLPKHITSTTGMDALTHAVEAYIGRSNTKETEEAAIEATKLIFKYLKRAYDNGSDLEAREKMQYAAYLAGVAFTRAYVGNVHAMAHTLGGFYGVPHGLANSILLPYILEFYGESAHKRLARLAEAVGIDGETDAIKAKAFISAIKEMNFSMSIPDKISGIKEADIPTMAARAYAEANPLYPVPKIMDKDDMAKMFRKIADKVD